MPLGPCPQVQEEISKEREELMKTVAEFEKLSTEENSRLKSGKHVHFEFVPIARGETLKVTLLPPSPD